MKVLMILDENGHLHAFNGESQKVWIGLGVEAVKADRMTVDSLAQLCNLVAAGKWDNAEQLLEELDVICTGRSGDNRFNLVDVKNDWENGLVQFCG